MNISHNTESEHESRFGLPTSKCETTDLRLFLEPQIDGKIAIVVMSANTGTSMFRFPFTRRVAQLADVFLDRLRVQECEAEVAFTRMGSLLNHRALSLALADRDLQASSRLTSADESNLTANANVPAYTSADVQEVLRDIREVQAQHEC